MQVTKNYVQTFKEDLCHALIVEKSFLHWILSTIVFKNGKNTIIPGERSQHYIPDTIIPLSRERLDMAAYTISYHMENDCALEKDSSWGNEYFWELLLKLRFEELPITKRLASRKDVSVDFFSHLYQQPLHTFMRKR
jgi:hypothetical protein